MKMVMPVRVAKSSSGKNSQIKKPVWKMQQQQKEIKQPTNQPKQKNLNMQRQNRPKKYKNSK